MRFADSEVLDQLAAQAESIVIAASLAQHVR